MNNNIYDDITSIIKRAIDLLFLKNPSGTAMGVFFGIVLHWLSMLFLPAIKKIDFINPDALRLEYFIPFGIFLFNVHFVIIKGHKYDPNTEKALEQVRKAEKEKLITKNEAKIQYTNIIRSHVRSYDVEKNNFADKKA